MHTLMCSNDCVHVQDVGDMHILALLQQAQVQRAAEEALDHLDESCMQAEVASEQQQELELQVRLLMCVHIHPRHCATASADNSILQQPAPAMPHFALLVVMHQLLLQYLSLVSDHWWLVSSSQIVVHALSATRQPARAISHCHRGRR